MSVVQLVIEFFRQNEPLQHLFISILQDAAASAQSSVFIRLSRGGTEIGVDDPRPDVDWEQLQSHLQKLSGGGEPMLQLLQASRNSPVVLGFRNNQDRLVVMQVGISNSRSFEDLMGTV